MTGKYWDEGITLVPGCTKVSEGCEHCWAESDAHRFKRSFEPRFDEKQLARFGKGKPRIISIWNDLFHPAVTDEQISDTFDAMYGGNGQKNIYLILTKRADRLLEFHKRWCTDHIKNVWIGVTAENQTRWDERVPQLLAASPAHPWVMCEPLLGMILYPNFISKLHWVVAGAETGKEKRNCGWDWLNSIQFYARIHDIPFWGKAGYTEADRHYPQAITEWLK